MKHLMKAGILVVVLFLSAFVGMPSAASVAKTDVSTAAVQPASNDIGTVAKKSHRLQAYDYFMKDGTTAHFEGKGNEYADLTIRTEYLKENHVALYEDNGGTVVLRVYRLSKNRVELVKWEAEFYKEYNPTVKQLRALKPISVYLKFPIKKGETVDGRKIVNTDAAVSTPYKKFKKAIVFESKSKDGAINRTYFVKGFGEVKREFIMKEGKNTFKVTSSLESIKKQ
ncbi:hypothetical protein [Planomicrobium sp. CPCC 101079]|uniref:hypothetical protein n=1 Tax=Planomicrobium sp. CPCC 101079 TaxID=2599618 RepID=UPI0011B473E5|nr:hypothetical protein [Planomicrobium sp. CPCC 101079]TWT04942.1 hypothetical protein FQV28_10105 [Planomicrobium sp. CPCC 101079]